jgi:hypothetical protein
VSHTSTAIVKAFSTRSFVIIASVSWSYLRVFFCVSA